MVLSILNSVVSVALSILISISHVGWLGEKEGADMWDTNAFLAKMKQQNVVQRILTFGFLPAPTMEITYDDVMTDLFDDMKERTGFDFDAVTKVFPDLFYYARIAYYLMPDQFNKWRDDMILKGDEWEQQGDGAKKGQNRFLGSLIAMPKKAHFIAAPYENREGVYEIHILFTYGDGSTATLDTSAIYDTHTGEIGEWGGVAGIGYNFNAKHMYAYTTPDPPQRALGYIKLYDDLILKTTKMVNIDTIRLKFKYANKDWMLQLWKGRYFITSAGEVGLYNKPPDRLINWYNTASDQELVPMSFKLTAEGVAEPLVDRGQMNHWWMTGFALSDKIYLSPRLTLFSDITAPDQAFADGLVSALKEQQKTHKDLFYKTEGLTTRIIWGPGAAAAITAAPVEAETTEAATVPAEVTTEPVTQAPVPVEETGVLTQAPDPVAPVTEQQTEVVATTTAPAE